jgi:DNA-binding transcriptional MerR regulator/methylmalonyl-CoA mutase cobalamin-binding subunit
MPGTAEHLPIRTVSSLTGVKAITLRAWERRYGLIRPLRTPKGHRLYTRQHVELINTVLALAARGVALGQMRATLAAEGKLQPAAMPQTGPWNVYRQRMEAAIGRFDEQELDAVYDTALSLHSIQRVSELLLVPLLAQLGNRWTKVTGAVAEEHFFAVYLRNKLGARLHHRSQLTTGPKLLAACAPGEHHEIGLLLFALAAHDAGLRVVCLGANTPFDEIAIAVRRADCQGAVISSSIEPAPGLLNRELPALVKEANVPIFLGGAMSSAHRNAIAESGAVALGSDLDFGIQMIRTTLARSAGAA